MGTIKVAITGGSGTDTVASIIYAALSQHFSSVRAVSRDGTMNIKGAARRFETLKYPLDIVIIDDDGWVESNNS